MISKVKEIDNLDFFCQFYCDFNLLKYRYISSSKIMCISPKMKSIGDVYLALSIDGKNISMMCHYDSSSILILKFERNGLSSCQFKS